MIKFLQACDADIREAKFDIDSKESQKFVSELMLEYKQLQKERLDGNIYDETLPIKEKIHNYKLQCAFTTAVNRPPTHVKRTKSSTTRT